MSIKENFLIVSVSVNKPQMTQKDDKATKDAETANNADGAGAYRKDLYPKHLIAPIVGVESSARAYVTSQTYEWNRGERLLPAARIDAFLTRMGKYELEFSQTVTAFLNNWSNVMTMAQERQGALFNPGAYPDLSDLRSQFRFRVNVRMVTDSSDLRVKADDDVTAALRTVIERETRESMESVLREPLERLRKAVAHLHTVSSKEDRVVLNKKTRYEEIRPPIFHNSVIDNIVEEIELLHQFKSLMTPEVMAVAESVKQITVSPQKLREDPEARDATKVASASLLAVLDDMMKD